MVFDLNFIIARLDPLAPVHFMHVVFRDCWQMHYLLIDWVHLNLLNRDHMHPDLSCFLNLIFFYDLLIYSNFQMSVFVLILFLIIKPNENHLFSLRFRIHFQRMNSKHLLYDIQLQRKNYFTQASYFLLEPFYPYLIWIPHCFILLFPAF